MRFYYKPTCLTKLSIIRCTN